MKPLRLLVVEDELKIAQALHDFLRVEGYAVEVLHEGSSVVDWVRRESPDAVLLDVMLPGKDGLHICRELREFSSLPILMLTARVEEVDRLLGLDLGADDYLCKPFSLRELAARLRAVLRRCRTETVVDPRCEWQLDAERWELRLGNQSVPLTPVEFRLLQHLMGKPGRGVLATAADASALRRPPRRQRPHRRQPHPQSAPQARSVRWRSDPIGVWSGFPVGGNYRPCVGLVGTATGSVSGEMGSASSASASSACRVSPRVSSSPCWSPRSWCWMSLRLRR